MSAWISLGETASLNRFAWTVHSTGMCGSDFVATASMPSSRVLGHVEVHDRLDVLEIVGVLGHLGPKLAQALLGIELRML